MLLFIYFYCYYKWLLRPACSALPYHHGHVIIVKDSKIWNMGGPYKSRYRLTWQSLSWHILLCWMEIIVSI